VKKTKTQLQLELNVALEQIEKLKEENTSLARTLPNLKEKEELQKQLEEASIVNSSLRTQIDNHWKVAVEHTKNQVNVLEKRVAQLNGELDNSWKSYHKEVVRLDKLIDAVLHLSITRSRDGREKS